MVRLSFDSLESRSLPSTALLAPLAPLSNKSLVNQFASDGLGEQHTNDTTRQQVAGTHQPPRNGIIAVLIGL